MQHAVGTQNAPASPQAERPRSQLPPGEAPGLEGLWPPCALRGRQPQEGLCHRLWPEGTPRIPGTAQRRHCQYHGDRTAWMLVQRSNLVGGGIVVVCAPCELPCLRVTLGHSQPWGRGRSLRGSSAIETTIRLADVPVLGWSRCCTVGRSGSRRRPCRLLGLLWGCRVCTHLY